MARNAKTPPQRSQTAPPNLGQIVASAPVPEQQIQMQGADDAGTGEQAVQPTTLPVLQGKFKLDMNGQGLFREVEASELQEAFMAQHQMAEAQREAEQLRQQNGMLSMVAQGLEQMSDDQRRVFLEALSDPSKLQPKQAASEDDFDDDLDDLRPVRKQANGRTNGHAQSRDPEFDTLKQAVIRLLEDRQQQASAEEERTLSQNIEREILQYDQFKPENGGSKQAVKFLSQYVQALYMRDPGANLKQLVARAATEHSDLLASEVKRRAPQQYRPSEQSVSIPIPSSAASGDAIRTGALQAWLRSQRQG